MDTYQMINFNHHLLTGVLGIIIWWELGFVWWSYNLRGLFDDVMYGGVFPADLSNICFMSYDYGDNLQEWGLCLKVPVECLGIGFIGFKIFIRKFQDVISGVH